MIFLYILLFVLVIIILLSWYIASSIFKPRTWDYEKTKEHELNKGLIDPNYMSNFNVEDVYITNDNIKLHAHLINNHSSHTIIMMHGHTFSLYGGYKYIKIFLDKGMNVLLPDQRFHGLSEGKNTTLGYKEQTDLEAWTNYILKTIPETKTLGYHGESMGAATVLLNGHNKHINYIISDCGFSNLKEQTQELLWKNYKIPPFMVYPTHIVASILYDAPLLKINPRDNIKNITVPILFIHGDNDQYVLHSHVEKLTKNAKEFEVYLAPGADHAESLEKDFEIYNNKVTQFLRGRNLL